MATDARAPRGAGVPLWGFFLLSAIYTWPIFVRPFDWGINDWDHDLFWHAFARESLVRYFQFPLWCPYLNGGVPYLARAESSVLSPLFLPILVLGEHLGLRVSILVHTWIGLIGTYLLSNHLGLGRAAAAFAAFSYGLSGFMAVTLTAGMTQFLPTSYLPLIFYCFLRGTDRRFLVAGSLLLAIVIGEGGVYQFVVISCFLLAYAVLSRERAFGPLGRVLVTLSLSVLFGALKILPFLELMTRYPRPFRDSSGFTLTSMLFSLAHPEQGLHPTWRPIIPEASYGLDEHGMYVGVLTLLLAATGILATWRRERSLLAVLLLFFWISLGVHGSLATLHLAGAEIRLGAWDLLRQLPVFSSMRVAQRFRFPFLLLVSIFAAFGVQHLLERLARKPRWRRVFWSVLLLHSAHVAWANASVFREAFVIAPAATMTRDRPFQQIRSLHPGLPFYYEAYLLNLGTVDGELSHYSLPATAIPREAPDYRGEFFLYPGEGTIQLVRWTPNRLTFKVHLTGPAALVINQSYMSGWRAVSSSGAPRPVLGLGRLIGVPLLAGEDEVSVYFLPESVIRGAVLSGASVLGALAFLSWSARGGRTARFADGRRPRRV